MPRNTSGLRPPWKKGQAPNPKGSPYGSRHRTARLLDKLGEDAATELFASLLAAARAGDTQAAGIIVSRVWPVRKGAPLRLNLPDLKAAGATAAALRLLVRSMSSGRISPEEADAAARVIRAHAEATELADLAERVRQLEQGVAPYGPNGFEPRSEDRPTRASNGHGDPA
jgi:hypothetical protein